MVDWEKLAKKAGDVVEKRGGIKSLEEDAAELGGIAREGGSLSEKARAAMEAIKEPGAPKDDASPGPGDRA